MNIILSTVDVDKNYSGHVALNKVSIAVPESSIFGLLGPNGAGKTTLIRIINQITAPDNGKIYYQNRLMERDDIYSIGYLPEERGLYKKMKVGEQALYLAQLKGISKNDAIKRIKYWFEKYEMQGWWNKKVEELSKGMQQKVQFITTILHEPKLLIFDEPFSGFDPINASMLKQEILDLKTKGSTIIFSTHNMSSVEELCDHITLINKAECILDGPIDEIKQKYKSNRFMVTFRGDKEKLNSWLNDKFEIEEIESKRDLHAASIKILNGHVDNDLLALLLPHIQIVSFEEILPSMNDIFIDVVEKHSKK